MTTVTKALLGEEDLNYWGGNTSTFTRRASLGGTVTMTKFGYVVDALWSHGGGSNYTSAVINAAIDAIGSTSATLLLRPGTWVMAHNITIPSNITLKTPRGAIITTTGYTLAINGGLEVGLYKVFNGTGTVTFGAGTVLEAYPEWWGAVGDSAWPTDTGTNDYAALQAAITAHRKVRLSKIYRYTTALSITVSGQEIYGISGVSCGLTPSGCDGFDITTNLTTLHFHDFSLWGMASAVYGFHMTGYVMRSVWERMQMGFFTSATVSFAGGLRNFLRDNYFSCGAAGSATANNIHLHVVSHPTDGACTTLATQGNYFAYGSSDAARPQVYIVGCVTYTSISDIFENAEVGMQLSTCTGVVIIGQHGETLGTTPIRALDCKQGVAISCQNAVTVTWSAVDADERFFIQTQTLGYGEIFGVGGISNNNSTAAYNMSGSVTLTGSDTQATWTFEKTQGDASYKAIATCTAADAGADAGSTTVLKLVKATSGVTVVVGTPPGGTDTVTFDIVIMR